MTYATVLGTDNQWAGGFSANGDWILMRVTFDSSGEVATGTVDLPLSGEKSLTIDDLIVTANQVRFVLELAGSKTVLEGVVTNDAIIGKAKSETGESQFQLVQVAYSSSEFPAQYMGIYELAPGHDVFIGNMVGSFEVAYYDFKTGRIAAIFPRSNELYFSGRELFIPFPDDIRVRFMCDEDGKTTSLEWDDQDQPQLTAPKVEFETENVEFSNGDVRLKGAIVLPVTAGPHPAVVIVHGSGPQTRQMVQIYAEAFARRGIATLIYDKRGVGESSGDWQSSYSDLADDALAGVDLLKSHSDICPYQIGLCGASQAGWIIPIAASRSADIAFIVLLVSPAVSIAQQNMLNVEYSMRASGYSEDDIHEAVAHISLFNHVLCTGEKWEDFQSSLAIGRHSTWAKYAWPLENPPTADSISDRRANMERDPLPILQQVSCPILAIFGDADTVVPYKKNLALMKEALQESNHEDFTFHVLPNCTHIFTKSQNGADADFPHTTHWLPAHIDLTTDWILARASTTEANEA